MAHGSVGGERQGAYELLKHYVRIAYCEAAQSAHVGHGTAVGVPVMLQDASKSHLWCCCMKADDVPAPKMFDAFNPTGQLLRAVFLTCALSGATTGACCAAALPVAFVACCPVKAQE